MRVIPVVACIVWTAGCGFPRPAPVGEDDAGVTADATTNAACAANQALRCDSGSLVRCNAEGTAEITATCSLGCNAVGPRCNDVNPSNGLAHYLDMTAGEPDIDLGTSATIDTDTGTVMVGGASVVLKSAIMPQISAPAVRVFIVHGFTAGDVKVTGKNAIAVVSNGDLKVGGVFAASAALTNRGAGGFNDGTCRGGDQTTVTRGLGGTGGGGFGFAGGRGGTATNGNGTAAGGAGGSATGNAILVPLRGGCDSGTMGAGLFGAGGGAVQLVSRTRIVVSGVVAANGSSASGGGSGGGILLEAPLVEVSGAVVANGGAGSGGELIPAPAEDGRLDATPATGGIGVAGLGSDGGNGGAGNSGAGNGLNITSPGDTGAFGGHGGGGVGRIRVNTVAGDVRTTGLFSPNPSTGTLATR